MRSLGKTDSDSSWTRAHNSQGSSSLSPVRRAIIFFSLAGVFAGCGASCPISTDRDRAVAAHRSTYKSLSSRAANAIIHGKLDDAANFASKMFEEAEARDSGGVYLSDLKSKSRRELLQQALIDAYREHEVECTVNSVEYIHRRDLNYVLSKSRFGAQ
jgi:hypothetical protein